MAQLLSVKQHIQQQRFKNDQPWWNKLATTERLFTESLEPVIDSTDEEDEDLAFLVNTPSGAMSRRLPDLSEIENDEEYFDS